MFDYLMGSRLYRRSVLAERLANARPKRFDSDKRPHIGAMLTIIL